ncbi:MAG: SPOR domain-containing protein [Ignavibacteriaceae bacterium]
MTKNELIKTISKKAKVPNNKAIELFDMFLLKIADKITLGHTALIEDVGYFHLRKGKIRNPGKGVEKEKFEYHDFLILSRSTELNINSTGNLVLKVPEFKNEKKDAIDSYFSPGLDKPELHNAGKVTSVNHQIQLADVNRKELEKKVDSIMSEVKTAKSATSKNGVLLIDVRKRNKANSEVNSDDNTKEFNSINSAGDRIQISNRPKDIESHFGKDYSQQIDEDFIKKVKDFKKKRSKTKTDKDAERNIEARNWEKVSEPVSEMAMGDMLNLDNKGENSLGSEGQNINRKFKRIKLKDPSANKNKNIEPVVNKKEPIKEVDTNPFVENDNKKYNKVIGGEEQMNTEKFREPSKVKETLAGMSELEEDKYIYDTEINNSYRSYRDRGSRITLLIIFGAIIVIGGGLYFFFQNGSSEVSEQNQFVQSRETVNTTYVDRKFDIPITYPYVQPEAEIQIYGLSPELFNSAVSKEPLKTEQITTKVPTKIESTPPQNLVEQSLSVSGEQVALNIFKYDQIYVVQVAAFRSKSVAENEVAKFVKLGYKPFIEEAVVNGKNWYRVRVGDFNTLEAAKQFQK